MDISNNYLDKLRKKSENSVSNIYSSHQLLGLELAKILRDEKHKSLYIKLAKTKDPSILMSLAKSTAEKSGVRNMGAYFMSLVYKKQDILAK